MGLSSDTLPSARPGWSTGGGGCPASPVRFGPPRNGAPDSVRQRLRRVAPDPGDAVLRSWKSSSDSCHEGRPVSVLELRTNWSDSSTAKLVAEGEIVDPPDEAELHDAICAAVKQHATEVLIDLTGVAFMGSVGLNALVRAHCEAKRLGCTVTVVGVSPLVRRVLEVTDLAELFGLDEG